MTNPVGLGLPTFEAGQRLTPDELNRLVRCVRAIDLELQRVREDLRRLRASLEPVRDDSSRTPLSSLDSASDGLIEHE